ncbi:LOW QUALITY PROTEIN: T-cell-specific surface glycoprotein CD28 [Choloepus didactylus]|uniref:LOW QUALITY PROTEIN: T-cell-specific surface glycoprotein CD28 n=1 Tax=Choloepus didactylus TaxID=27675 RepID=UPI0018A11AB7|nr:LOW QUALITY PROTEIN: T-cell-specific surface glycoprotein CD28 [Choloepus didactylus]
MIESLRPPRVRLQLPLLFGLLGEEGLGPWPTCRTMIFRLLLALHFFPSIEASAVNSHDYQKTRILVKQSPRLVAYNNAVNISCKYNQHFFSKEFRASLYKGVDSAVEVCVVNGNYAHQLQFHSVQYSNCDGKLDNETVTFYLWNLDVNQTDIYFCKIEIIYPPPYIGNEKSNGTIIHVKEKHLCPTHQSSESSVPFWVLVALFGGGAVYSFVTTVCLCICWKKNRRSRILQSDYMNMTPRRPGPTRKHYQPYAPARDFAAYRS